MTTEIVNGQAQNIYTETEMRRTRERMAQYQRDIVARNAAAAGMTVEEYESADRLFAEFY